jgi:hypothetical protein
MGSGTHSAWNPVPLEDSALVAGRLLDSFLSPPPNPYKHRALAGGPGAPPKTVAVLARCSGTLVSLPPE